MTARCPSCGRPGYCPACGRTAYSHGRRYQQAGNSAGNGGPWIIIGFILIVIAFWPAMVWHGEGGPAGTSWRWDIHSTIAELIYWGVIAAAAGVYFLGHRADRAAAREEETR
ncbi:MAG TPA: hypothetical protein VKV80_20115 [Streptosporangiaceae bacterium]|nr:hypothetical protein [Streptosporangiaceae bacterium]